MMELPANYSKLSWRERKECRERYTTRQAGKCSHCQTDLTGEPAPEILAKQIHWILFPPNFLDHPVHLHHNHDTDLTIGAVHAYCNAVLWQHHGE